ncbi:uncharacterized protein LOC120421984 [Culex pipiens pallens]|uniref:uncharacterized protein LOC120421984 n=1 Tax=Culex pipiens pallens TaxID=42434 RepID=UPI0019548002|nr:uncharacterized protein LOC120421984 [Culex pipiens pallens]
MRCIKDARLFSNSIQFRIQTCLAMWSVVLLSLGLLANGSRGDLGLTITIPNLVADVQAAIGQGIAPITNANSTIQVNVGSDVSGALQAVVAESNAISISIGPVFQATQLAASDSTNPPSVVFANLYGTVNAAKLVLEQSAGVLQQFQPAVSDRVYLAITSNLTKLQDDLDVLTLNLIALGTAVNVVQLTNIIPITSLNVGSIVTPALVASLTNTLKSLSTSVANLGFLFNDIVKQTTDAISIVSSTNSTASAAIATLGTQLTSFINSVATVGNRFGLVLTTLSNNIAAVHSPITGASSSFNGGNIVNLTQYLNTVVQSTQQLSQNLTTLFQDLQNNVQQTFVEQVDVAINQIYSASLGLAQRAGISDSIFKNNCYQKYNLLLQQPSVQVSRLNACLLSEADSLTKIQQLLDYLLAQVQTDATAITNNKLATCTTLNGACILSVSFCITRLQIHLFSRSSLF